MNAGEGQMLHFHDDILRRYSSNSDKCRPDLVESQELSRAQSLARLWIEIGRAAVSFVATSAAGSVRQPSLETRVSNVESIEEREPPVAGAKIVYQIGRASCRERV